MRPRTRHHLAIVAVLTLAVWGSAEANIDAAGGFPAAEGYYTMQFADTTSILTICDTICDVAEFDAALERATSDEWSLDSFPWYAVSPQPRAVSRLLRRSEHVLPTGTISSSHARGPPSPGRVSPSVARGRRAARKRLVDARDV
jgi:hypothetical protein